MKSAPIWRQNECSYLIPVTAIILNGCKYLNVKALLLSNIIRIPHVLPILPCNRKLKVLSHFNKTHVKKARFCHLMLQEFKRKL